MKESLNTVPIWEKILLTVDEAAELFGIGKKKIREMAHDYLSCENCFAIQNGSKLLINRRKFEDFLNHTTSI